VLVPRTIFGRGTRRRLLWARTLVIRGWIMVSPPVFFFCVLHFIPALVRSPFADVFPLGVEDAMMNMSPVRNRMGSKPILLESRPAGRVFLPNGISSSQASIDTKCGPCTLSSGFFADVVMLLNNHHHNPAPDRHDVKIDAETKTGRHAKRSTDGRERDDNSKTIRTYPVLPHDLATDIQQFVESDYAKRYFSTHRTGFIFRRRVPLQQMMTWQKVSLMRDFIFSSLLCGPDADPGEQHRDI
jgi:hypothetical protein